MRSLVIAIVICAASIAGAAQQMPNPREMSGIPREAAEQKAGSISVRVIRGNFDKNIAGQPVEFTVDGKKEVRNTDASGRSEIAGLKPGARVTAVTVVDGERLVTQEIVIGAAGIRVLLVATDPEASKREEEERRLASSPAVKGTVVFGPQSRVIAEFNNDRLNVFYLLDVINTARTPVDIGGPLFIDLPTEARGAGMMAGSSPQAKVAGARVTVMGPFAPGPTSVQVGFELPFSGDTAQLHQVWPVMLQTLNLIVGQSGAMEIRSAQITNRRIVTDQGPPAISAVGPAIAAGQSLDLEITGLPHHASWPRYLALTLSGVILTIGLWAAVFPSPRRRAA